MDRLSRFTLRAFFVLGLVFSATLLVLLVIPTTKAMPLGAPLNLFAAPSHIPAGESWVFIGSKDDLPADLDISAIENSVTILEVQKLSKSAISVRVQTAIGTQGKLLRASLLGGSSATDLDVYVGQTVPSLCEDANIKSEDFVNGSLSVPGNDFVYAYLQGTDVPLAAVRIHNRQTGLWHCHELKEEKTKQENAPVVQVDPKVFVEVDRSAVDSDGDNIPDVIEKENEITEPVPEQLGVSLIQGLNFLDIVSVDEAGNASWKLIQVHSSGAGGQGGF